MKGLTGKSAKGKGPSGARTHHSSTSWGDDEYAQVIEGVKKIYKTKIKPLEVTYNFEGKIKMFFYLFIIYG
jgi:hypothetical protein